MSGAATSPGGMRDARLDRRIPRQGGLDVGVDGSDMKVSLGVRDLDPLQRVVIGDQTPALETRDTSASEW